MAWAADVATLARWLRQDVLAVAGPDLATRQELYDFLVAELQARQADGPPTLQAACTALVNGRDALLAFAAQLDADLAALGAELAGRVVRASSVAENLNSRLRGYFQLWRQVGAGSLALLQFSLNHRRFPRSDHPERVGKSPAELLTGETHAHWLELLGYQRFSRN